MTARRVLWIAAAAGFALAASLAAQGTGDTGTLDSVVHDYQTISASWLSTLLPLTQRLFAILAAIEFAVSGAIWLLNGRSLDEMLGEFIRKFILIAFLLSLILTFQSWIPKIVEGFEFAGQRASGTPTVNPSAILDMGVTIASNMLLSFGSLGFLANPGGNMLASFTAFLTLIAFSVIAATLCITLVETYVVLTGGVLFLGFAAFRGTARFAENYINYAFRVSIKIFMLYLLVGVGSGLARKWASLTFVASFNPADGNLTQHFHVMAASLVLCLLVWILPNSVASNLSTGSFNIPEALR